MMYLRDQKQLQQELLHVLVGKRIFHSKVRRSDRYSRYLREQFSVVAKELIIIKENIPITV